MAGVAERSRRSPLALLEYGLFLGALALLDALPQGAAYAIGAGIGRLAHRLDRRHREIARENLARAFPETPAAEIDRLLRRVFDHLGCIGVDVARSHRILRPGAAARIPIDGFDRIQAARARGKGVLVITAHIGPWELLPLVASQRYEPLSSVARPMDNPWIDDRMTAMRERGGNRVIRKRDAGQAILQAMRRGETVGILIDQHIREEEGVVVPFFGRPASTVFAPALLAMRAGAAVIPAGLLREGPGRYRIRVWPEVALQRSGNLQVDLAENTARFTAAIETMIREHPEQWFWVHRRWKTPWPLDPRLAAAETAGEGHGHP
jgi:Kdo2-lipid IVA lauroyltransferase/acyltransferase